MSTVEPQLDALETVSTVALVPQTLSKQMKLMLNHLELFLASLTPPIILDQFDKSIVNQNFLQQFALYLAKTAVRLDRAESTLISLQTAENYFSAFKTFYFHKFGRDRDLPPCMAPVNWASYLSSIVLAKKEGLKRGERLVNPRECASEDDRKAIAAICLWNGDLDSAEFFLFLSTAYQFAGRGGEVAALTRSSFGTIIGPKKEKAVAILNGI